MHPIIPGDLVPKCVCAECGIQRATCIVNTNKRYRACCWTCRGHYPSSNLLKQTADDAWKAQRYGIHLAPPFGPDECAAILEQLAICNEPEQAPPGPPPEQPTMAPTMIPGPPPGQPPAHCAPHTQHQLHIGVGTQWSTPAASYHQPVLPHPELATQAPATVGTPTTFVNAVRQRLDDLDVLVANLRLALCDAQDDNVALRQRIIAVEQRLNQYDGPMQRLRLASILPDDGADDAGNHHV